MKKSRKPTKGEAWQLLIIGLIMGTVFTFGTQYWNAPITPDEAEQVTATFSSYKEAKRKSHVKEIIIRFDDHEQLSIDGVSIDDDLRDAISEIEAGTTIEMLVHPNSNTILEMTIGNTKLLAFHDSMQKLSSEASVFICLGIFCYLSALIGAGYLIFGKLRCL
ncbi:MAG: hypothetical protein E7332_02740 [Clostridiales bacterium]|nr:hypothetical protein [Clostridiales bacterium]